MDELVARPSISGRALLFVILTAARWSEIDGDERVWTVPAGRMKAGREHRVPLSPPALAVLDEVRPLAAGAESPVFPAPGRGPLSQMAPLMTLRRLDADGRWRDPSSGRPVTVHGFRASLRTWAGETTSHPFEVVEAALAHAVGDRTVQAYARGDLFERRRALMEEWAAFCVSGVRGADETSSASSE